MSKKYIADKFVVDGETDDSKFLKGDGTLDSNTYLEEETNLFLGKSGSLLTTPGTSRLTYTGPIGAGTSGLFSTINNANSVITLNKHIGNYDSQLGFSSNGSIYYRNFINTAINTTQAWEKILTSSDADDYYLKTGGTLTVNPGTSWNDQIQILGDAGNATDGYGIAFRGDGHHRGGLYAVNSGYPSSSSSQIRLWSRSGTVYIDSNNSGANIASFSTLATTFKNDVTIQGDLTINGSYTQIDTDVNTTEQWLVTNDGTGPAAIINQLGSNDIIDIQDDGTSVFYIEDGGNVGMGTTDPSEKLEVAGKIASIGGTNNAKKININVNDSWGYLNTTAADFYINKPIWVDTGKIGSYNEDLQLRTGANTRITVLNSNGNVGIGTINPSADLEVSRTGDATIRISADSDNDSGEVGSSILEMTTDGGGHGWKIINENESGGTGDFKVNAFTSSTDSTKLLIDRYGKVGIGTESPNELLHVSSDAAATEAYLNITSSTVPRMRLGYSFTDGPSISDADAWVTVDSAGDLDISSRGNIDSNIILYTSDGTTHSEKMRIMGDGDIGIGTASPEEKLHVIGNVRADSFGSEESSTLTRVFSPKGASFKGATTETGFICITLPQGFTNTMMSFVVNVYDYATNESMKIKVFGYTYSVSSTWYNATAIIDSSPFKDKNFPVKFGTDGTKAVVSIGDVTDTWTWVNVSVTEFIGSHSNFALEDWNDGWDISILNSTTGYSFNITQSNNQVNNWGRNGDDLYYSSGTGNVGIGTTSPSEKLEVNGNIKTTGNLNIESEYPRINFTDTNNNSDYSIINANGSFRVYDITNTSNRLSIDSLGKVGIGTDSPTEKLMVEGSIALSMGDDAMATITPKFEGIEFRVDDGANSSSSVDMSLQDSITGTGLNVYGYIESAFNTDEDGGGSFRVIRTIDGATNNPRSYSDKTILTNPSTSAISYAGIDINAQMDDGTYGHHTGFQLRTSLETATVGDYEGVYTQAFNFVDATVTNYVGSTTKTPFTFDADSSITNMIGNHVIAEDANGSLTNLYGLKIETGTSPATNMWSVHAPDVDMNALMAGNLEVGSISVGTSVTSNKLEVAGTGRFDNNGVGDKVALIVRNGDSSSSTSRATTEYWVGASDYAEVSVGGSSGYGDIEFRTRATSSMNTSMKIHGTGNVTIGTTTISSDKLHVQGAVKSSSTFTGTNFILSSDSRLKQNVQEAEVSHINVDWKTFEMKSDKGQKRYGVIAQELEESHPEFVRTDDKGMKSVAYVDLLIAKIAELEARLEKAGL